jgi:hypothetical protein
VTSPDEYNETNFIPNLYGSQVVMYVGSADDQSYQQAFTPDIPADNPIVFIPQGLDEYESYA